MFLHIIVAVCLCVAAWLVLHWSRVRLHWAERKVPHFKLHPLWGSLTFIMKQNPALWFKSYYDNFKSPYVGIWLFWRPAIIVNSFELARRITVTDSDNFRDRFLGSVKKDPLAVNIFLGKDPMWSSIRRRLSGVFTSAKMKAFQNLIVTKSNELVQRIRNDQEKKIQINLRKLFIDFTTDIVSITSFGVESEATLTGKGHMRDVTTALSSFSIYKGLSWCSVFYFPEVADLFGLTFFPKKTMDYFRKIFRAVVAQRGGYGQEKTQIRDLLDALLHMKQEAAKDGEEIDEDTLIAQAAVFLLGGFDTTAMALTYSVYELAYSPTHVQEFLKDFLVHHSPVVQYVLTNFEWIEVPISTFEESVKSKVCTSGIKLFTLGLNFRAKPLLCCGVIPAILYYLGIQFGGRDLTNTLFYPFGQESAIRIVAMKIEL